MNICNHCGNPAEKRKINRKIVCESCYNDFREKSFAVQFDGLKIPKSEQWWNW